MIPSSTVVAGSAPIARITTRSCSRLASWRAMTWIPRNRAARAAMPPNAAECERLGPYRLLGFGLELRRHLEVGEVALARIPPPLHGRDVARASSQLHAQVDVAAVGGHRCGQGRRRHDVGGEFGDLVLHDLSVQQADADDLEPDPPDRPRTRGRRERDRDDLSEMQSHRRRRTLRDHDLVGAGGIGHASARDGEAILVEEEAVDAAHEDDVAVEAARLDPSGVHERRVQHLVALDPRHLRVGAHRVDEPLRQVGLTEALPARRLDHEVRGIRRGKERRERRRRPAGGSQRSEGDTADQADEEDEHDVARSLALPADDRAVPGGVHGRGAHRAAGGSVRSRHPDGRGGSRVLHCSSLTDRQSIANEVSRRAGLVVARAPTCVAWTGLPWSRKGSPLDPRIRLTGPGVTPVRVRSRRVTQPAAA